MTLTVGKVPYFNAYPLFFPFSVNNELFSDTNWQEEIPSTLNKKLRKNELDLSLISSVEYLDHAEKYQILHPLCIASREKAMSVNLYVKKELDIPSLHQENIAITTHTSTSVALLEIFCYHFCFT